MTNAQPQPLKTLSSERTLQKINQGTRRTHMIDLDYSHIKPEFVGKVVVHHPSQMERLQQGILQSHLLGGADPQSLDTLTYNLAMIISTLEIVIDKKPDWFDVYDDELDYSIIEETYLEYVKWINSFRTGAKKPVNVGDSKE